MIVRSGMHSIAFRNLPVFRARRYFMIRRTFIRNTFRQNYLSNIFLSLFHYFFEYIHIFGVLACIYLMYTDESNEKYEVMTHRSTINRMTKFTLILFGIWPDTSCIIFCRIFWTVTVAIVLLCHYLYFLTHYHSDDVFDLMDCFSSFLGFFKLMIKFIFFWLNQR